MNRNPLQAERAEGDPMEATFLIGAGVSVAVGMPSTSQITNAVLRGAGFGIHSSGCVLYEPSLVRRQGIDLLHQDDVQAFQTFLRLLEARIRLRRLPYTGLVGAPPNYEDIYYVVHTLQEHLAGEAWDPLAEEYWLQIRPSLPKALANASIHDHVQWLRRCLVFLRGAVASYLLCAEDTLAELRNLRVFRGCAADASRTRIFTLNHNTVLERYFIGECIDFFDGLMSRDGDMQWLMASEFEHHQARVQLFKLHGSTRWYYWRTVNEATPSGRYGYSPSNALLPEDGAGRAYSRGDGADPNPIILVGTLNKAASYQWEPFPQLLGLFVSCLNTTEALIVCGHSFGDRFIRGHLANWRRGNRKRRIVLIDPCAESIARRLQLTELSQGLVVLEKGIQDIRWEEVKQHVLASS